MKTIALEDSRVNRVIPDIYAIDFPSYTYAGTAQSAQECVDLVSAADPAALAVAFYNTNGSCFYRSQFVSYDRRAGGEDPAIYLRTDHVAKGLFRSDDCLSKQDAEYLIARLAFGDEKCTDVRHD